MNWKYLFIWIIFIPFVASSSDKLEKLEFDQAKENIIMRQIGHEILLYSGDTESRVLPVQKTDDRSYQIRFESPFSFEPDSLVSIIDEVVARHQLSNDYIVNVLDCQKNEVVYGYAILNSKQNNIVPCGSRVQPENCYFIQLQFADIVPSVTENSHTGLVAASLGIGLLFMGIWTFVKNKREVEIATISSGQMLPIGNAIFYFEEQYLKAKEGKIKLTPTEANLLHLFINSPNQVIEKSVIQKEIWNHDGEIVSRSLDVFISKLRKKLQSVESVQLVNIHGRGYRLEVLDV